MPNNNHPHRDRQPNGAHNPAPFDFVPFSNVVPITGKIEEWEKVDGGGLFSGYIEFKLVIKTPLHIVGKQTKNADQEITESLFLRRHGVPLIPGSGLKGMLRAFMEALTNSWVSQATDEHKKEDAVRAHGFNAFSSSAVGAHGPVIPVRLHPKIVGGGIDLATFLFGAVFEGGDGDNAFPSRLVFEDAIVNERHLVGNAVSLPDVPGKAFMGEAKPRINNWWYFKPKSISKKMFRDFELADFMGSEFWGRKFYYHQKPENALAWYANKDNWPHRTQAKVKNSSSYKVENNYRSYRTEVIKENAEITGKIYFKDIPQTLLGLVILSLNPGGITHKMGYGQAFGLGSVAISEIRTYIYGTGRFDADGEYLPLDGKNLEPILSSQFVDGQALKWLKRILRYDAQFIENARNIFTYPLFSPVLEDCVPGVYPNKRKIIKNMDFAKTVRWPDAKNIALKEGAAITGNTIALNSQQAKLIAERLWGEKKTIHFRVYQENSRLWPGIEKRAP